MTFLIQPEGSPKCINHACQMWVASKFKQLSLEELMKCTAKMWYYYHNYFIFYDSALCHVLQPLFTFENNAAFILKMRYV